MKQITSDIMNLTSGVIVHQVNCQDSIGAGISGTIIKKYPVVETAYHWLFTQMTKEQIFGRWQPVPVTDELIIVNMFTQFRYGNPARSHQVYTDVDKLIAALMSICNHYPDKEIYIPERIGCGFGGANWDDLLTRLEPLRVTIVKQTEAIKRTYRACTKSTDKVMEFHNEYYFLSNMYPCPIHVTIDNKEYHFTCAEALYQGMKNTDYLDKFENTDGYTAKRMGKRVQMREDWDEVKLAIMQDVVRLKFTQNPDLMKRLRATSGELIEGNTWGDTYWGICHKIGENHLGKILMALRDETK